MKISNETIAVLEDIENRLDPETEDDFLKQWEDFLYDRFDGEVFAPKRKDPKPMGFEVTPEMMSMMSGFTVLRLLTMAGGMMDAKFTKEDLLDLNKKLSRIKQPKPKKEKK